MHIWSLEDVIDELVGAGLGQFANFLDNKHVDGAALLAICESGLNTEPTELLPFGASVKLLRWIEDMRKL